MIHPSSSTPYAPLIHSPADVKVTVGLETLTLTKLPKPGALGGGVGEGGEGGEAGVCGGEGGAGGAGGSGGGGGVGGRMLHWVGLVK